MLSNRIFLEHDGGAEHPESPERLRRILSALGEGPGRSAGWREAGRPATFAELCRAHDPEHVRQVMEIARAPGPWPREVGVEVPIGAGSLDAALWAAGTVIEAIDHALNGVEVWVLVRPPGHHATRMRSQGFCVFNNVAIGALHALAGSGPAGGLPGSVSRVAVLDWDVHHGDGTQDIFWDRPDCALVSIHQHPLYPESGAADERGAHDNIVNIPLPSGSDDEDYARVLIEHAIPALDRLDPQLLIVSAGFDAQQGDPLAGMLVTPTGFGRMAELVRAWAVRPSLRVPLVFVLEGGYKVDTLADCVLSAMGRVPPG